LSCKLKFKEFREQAGVVCHRCGGTDHYWKSDKEQWECKACRARITLKSGTVMHKSKLPYRYWFIAMHLFEDVTMFVDLQEIGVCALGGFGEFHTALFVGGRREQFVRARLSGQQHVLVFGVFVHTVFCFEFVAPTSARRKCI